MTIQHRAVQATQDTQGDSSKKINKIPLVCNMHFYFVTSPVPHEADASPTVRQPQYLLVMATTQDFYFASREPSISLQNTMLPLSEGNDCVPEDSLRLLIFTSQPPVS